MTIEQPGGPVRQGDPDPTLIQPRAPIAPIRPLGATQPYPSIPRHLVRASATGEPMGSPSASAVSRLDRETEPSLLAAPVAPWPSRPAAEARATVAQPAAAAPERRERFIRTREVIRERKTQLIAAGLLAGALAGCLVALAVDRYLLMRQATSPTNTGQIGGVPGETCVVTPLLNKAPDKNPIVITVKPHETVEGGLWWENGNYPWGSNEVGVQFQAGDTDLTVTTNGRAGGSLWEYSAGCSSAKINGDRANYDASRRQNTKFAGDQSLQQLLNAGAVSSSQQSGSSEAIPAGIASAMHDRIEKRTAQRIRQAQPFWVRAFA